MRRSSGAAPCRLMLLESICRFRGYLGQKGISLLVSRMGRCARVQMRHDQLTFHPHATRTVKHKIL